MKIILTFLTCLVSTFFIGQEIQNNLLLFYPFDGNAQDISGNEYHADEFLVTYVEDRDGNPESAVYFNGVSSYINFPNLPELKPDLPVSFAFWIRYDSDHYTDKELFNTSFEDDRSSGVYLNTQQSTNKIAINFGDGSNGYNPTTRRSYITNYQAHLNTWISIVVVVESALNMKIYVNCRDYEGTYSGSGGDLVYSNTPGSLGRNDRDLGVPANYFKGALDDFRYWDKALTNMEVQLVCDSSLNFESVSLDSMIKLFPNPANDYFEMVSPVSFKHIQIVDLTGKVVLNDTYSEKQNIIGLKSGIYIVSLISDEHVVRKKLIVQ